MTLSDLEKLLDQSLSQKILVIVSCTKEKIWDENRDVPDYVVAKDAYTGVKYQKFLAWVDNLRLENGENIQWMILSGKYGFIEPSHPISNYDILLGDPYYHGISDESLINQVLQKRLQKGKEWSLNEFDVIICINCEGEYPNKIKKSFSSKSIYFFECF